MKYAVVTGATKGIGRAIAEKLLTEGYFVAGNYARDEAGARMFLDANKERADRLALYKCDLSGYDAACDLAAWVRRTCGAVDVLVCNSGTTDTTPFEQVEPEKWSRVLDVNIHAPAYLIRELEPAMTKNGGRIVMTGSILGGGVYPHARSISYGVSKAMVAALARELAEQFLPDGITVNCIEPGFVDTPWQAGKEPAHRKRIEDKIALHRFALPEEIAELCWSVVNTPGINGAVLTIDGGYCCE